MYRVKLLRSTSSLWHVTEEETSGRLLWREPRSYDYSSYATNQRPAMANSRRNELIHES